MTDSEFSIRTKLRYDTPSSKPRPSSRRTPKSSTPYRLKSAEKYLSNMSNNEDAERYSRSSSPLFLREQMKAESQIRAERDADLKTLRRSVSPKRPKSPGSKTTSPRSRSTSPVPLRYSGYSSAATPYDEYRSAISSLRNLRDNPSYLRSSSPPHKEDDSSSNLANSQRITSGVTLDSGIAVSKYADVQASMNYSSATLSKSPLGALKSPTWHKLDSAGLQDAVEESEQRRMLLVNRLKDAQDTLKLQSSTISSIKSEKERYKSELEALNYSKEESYNEKRNLTTRIKLMKSKCDELDEEVKELSRESQSLKTKMEDKTKQCSVKNERINELENELSAIRLSSADSGDTIAKLQDSYNRTRTQASMLEQQHSSLSDQNTQLNQERDALSERCRDYKGSLDEAEIAVSQLKNDLAVSERERRELEEERRIVISHKLDTQEALTKSNQLNMELQAQLDSLIEARDSFEQESMRLRDRVRAIQVTVSSKDAETVNRITEIEALQRENRTLRDINDNLKDRMDDTERSQVDAEHLIELLRSEKQELMEQKTELFNVNGELNEDLKLTRIELGDVKQEVVMLREEREDERAQRIQLQQMLDTLRHDSDTQKGYLESQCEDLEKDIQRLQKELEIQSDENSLVGKQLVEVREQVTYSKNKAEDWKNTAQSLEDSLNLSERERQGVVEDLLRIQNELTDLKDEYSVVADERNRFLDKYNELRSECEMLQEEVRELLLEKDENQHVLRLLETQKSILEEKWNGGKDLDTAQNECIEMRADVKACRDRVKDLEQQCDELRNELTVATDKITNLLNEKKVSHENLGRADATIDLLSNDKDRLQKQVAAVTREFERRVAILEEDYAGEQNKVLIRSQENGSLKIRLDEALNLHGTEKADLIKERNGLEDRAAADEKVREALETELKQRIATVEALQDHKKGKEAKENKLADALKAITGNPDVEDPYVEAYDFMRKVKGEKEVFEKEAAKIPGLQTAIEHLQTELDKSETVASSRGGELQLKSASIEQLETNKSAMEERVEQLETRKGELEEEVSELSAEKHKYDLLQEEHATLKKDHGVTSEELVASKKECNKVGDQKDSVDVENKNIKAENTKLSCELTDFKKALASKGDGERAMMEASNELRVVRDELENLMEIISNKDTKIEDLQATLDEMSNNLGQLNEEGEAKTEEIKSLRLQVREGERQRERTGELDLDSNSLLREKEEQIKRLEKWLESYKSKIEGLERQKAETEEEKRKLRDEKRVLEKQTRDLHETAKDEVIRRLHQVEDELRSTKQQLQMTEDDRRQDNDNKDLKTPEEVAKIIEDIKEAFEDEIADLLLQEREEYEKEKDQLTKEKENFRMEQEEFLRQAEEIAAEQLGKKNSNMDQMEQQLDSARSELEKYRSGS